MTENNIWKKIKQINEKLKIEEPESITIDKYSGYSGYKPQYIIDALNEILGINNWGFKEIKTHTLKENDKASLAIAQVEVWLMNKENLMLGWGQSRITRGDVGDAKKGAQTDAIKKALSYFSIGSKAYKGLLGNQNNKRR